MLTTLLWVSVATFGVFGDDPQEVVPPAPTPSVKAAAPKAAPGPAARGFWGKEGAAPVVKHGVLIPKPKPRTKAKAKKRAVVQRAAAGAPQKDGAALMNQVMGVAAGATPAQLQAALAAQAQSNLLNQDIAASQANMAAAQMQAANAAAFQTNMMMMSMPGMFMSPLPFVTTGYGTFGNYYAPYYPGFSISPAPNQAGNRPNPQLQQLINALPGLH